MAYAHISKTFLNKIYILIELKHNIFVMQNVEILCIMVLLYGKDHPFALWQHLLGVDDG